MSLTKSQMEAVAARKNVLVIAGAGTGKTKTLVERCLSIVLDEKPPVSIDEVLMVTFTDAAAAEMRKRIRARLEQEAAGPRGNRCQEQLALLDSAFIGTIHSFCYQLIRQHFYELEIDPKVTVMPKEEADLLAAETLHDLLAAHYEGDSKGSQNVRELVRVHGQGSDEQIRRAVLRVHHYTQTLHDPAEWFARQAECLSKSGASVWRNWLLEALPAICEEWKQTLQAASPDNVVASHCLKAIKDLEHCRELSRAAEALEEVLEACANCPPRKKTAFLKPLEHFREEAVFLLSLLKKKDGTDPLEQDWEWFRGPMLALLNLSRDFTAAFSEAKRELGTLDFHDLEQHALRLLWNFKAKEPTAVARHWRMCLKHVFVDEYQDVNEAQDKIISALSRDGVAANRFLVGDVKQSIYRFRLASPAIFRAYAAAWKPPEASVIPLSDNFRSRESLLLLTNSIFEFLMRREVGGIEYAGQALQFGGAEQRQQLGRGSDLVPRTELHLLVKGGKNEANEETESLVDLVDSEKEARLVGLRLLKLVTDRKPLVWDEELEAARPVEWGDIAILMRAPSKKAEAFSKVFSQLGIPLQVAKRGFFEATEITDLLSLLQILDNPLQDIPLIAVLHSPLGSMTVNDLAEVRLALRKTQFFTALTQCGRVDDKGCVTGKARAFLERYHRWRRLARQAPLSTCMERILQETHYREWLLMQPRGAERHANVQRLVALAREFDEFQRRGLCRFLKFLDAQKNSDVEPAVATNAKSQVVTLMSVHQSKGLEFPVVFLPDLGKKFNEDNLRDKLMLSEHYGLCSDIKPPHTRQRYPSLPLWLARRIDRMELLGEEMRLLYVAMTRARDVLILSAAVSEKKVESAWRAEPRMYPGFALGARCCADWLAMWFGSQQFLSSGMQSNDLISWRIWSDADLTEAPIADAQSSQESTEAESGADLMKKLAWVYPHELLASEPAKASVSALRRRKLAQDELGTRARPRWLADKTAPGRLSAADRGSAHHAFLEQCSLERPGEVAFLCQEVKRLQGSGAITKEEAGVLDLEAIAAFWQSEQGRQLLEHRNKIRRELPFTARFTPSEICKLAGLENNEVEDECVVIQGVADLVAIFTHDIWLFDFKTDAVEERDIEAKVMFYKPQMAIYAAALERIYNRPVTRSYLFFLHLRRIVGCGDAVEGQDLPVRGSERAASRAPLEKNCDRF